MMPDNQHTTGTVKWYNRKQGFGFVTPDTGGKDVFVHRSALSDHHRKALKPGDRITFTIERQQKGPVAAQITPIDPGIRSAPEPEVITERAPADNPSQFMDLALDGTLLRAIDDVGYTTPTPIQIQAITHVLNGRDILGVAQTGTGKTAAFALPILHNLSRHGHQPTPRPTGRDKRKPKHPIRVLVLSPTRELAIQIADSFTAYGQHTPLTNTVIFGGVGQNPQVETLQHGVDILVATPGRLLDLIGQGYVSLAQIEVLVLDEADRMLDMGFIKDVQRIIKHVPKKRQTLLFSATMPQAIVALADSILRDPVTVAVTPEQPTVEAIEQTVYFVGQKKKQALLEHVLRDEAVSRVLVFTRTKHGANRVVTKLVRQGIQAEPIHGNKSQTARQRALSNFREGRTRVLVATDVVARGIDVEHISHVIQFDLPNEPETYIHRIGRTGRAGKTGLAVAFCAEDERPYLKDIEKLIRMRVPVTEEHPYQI